MSLYLPIIKPFLGWLKREAWKLLFLVVVVAIFVWVLVHNKQQVYVNVINADVVTSKAFSLNAESVGLNTSITGTVFIKGEKNNPNQEYAEIVATLNLDPNDQGGVDFHVYEGDNWSLKSVDSDYPQGYSEPENEIIVSSQSNSPAIVGGDKDIQIGGQNVSEMGGMGSIVIDLIPAKTSQGFPQYLKINVGLGFQENAVGISLYPISETIQIPLD
jgi:hypothetical protein